MSVAANQGLVTARRYLEMAECGLFDDERVELLEGLIVAMTPPSPQHDSAVYRVHRALIRKLGPDVVVRGQSSFVASEMSVPQPDLAVVPGGHDDFWEVHPSDALLLVEISWSTLLQDRMTKAAIYAKAGVPCYWVVNLRDRRVETFRLPDRATARYQLGATAKGTDPLVIDAFPDVRFEACDLLPPPHIHY